MTWLDYAVLGVMGISIAWGIWRGLVREVISLAGWVIAFLAANLFAGPLAETLPASISRPRTAFNQGAPPQSYQPWAVMDALLSLKLSTADALTIVDTFLDTPMREPRYIRRLAKIRALEQRTRN